MLAPAGSSEAVADQSLATGTSEPGATPRIGNVRGGGRPHLLRYMPDAPSDTSATRCWQNHPTCATCGAAARPAILMFGDMRWNAVESQRDRFEVWKSVVHRLAGKLEKQGPRKLRVVILEFGAGNNVPTVRRTSESALQSFKDAGAETHLVRVNPDLPLGDMEEFRTGGSRHDLVIPVMGQSLAVLEKIRSFLPKHELLDVSCGYSTEGMMEVLRESSADYIPGAAIQAQGKLSRDMIRSLLRDGISDEDRSTQQNDQGADKVLPTAEKSGPDESEAKQTSEKLKVQVSNEDRGSLAADLAEEGALARVSGRLRAWDDTNEKATVAVSIDRSPPADLAEKEKGALAKVSGRLRAWGEADEKSVAKAAKSTDSASAASELESFLAKKASSNGFPRAPPPKKVHRNRSREPRRRDRKSCERSRSTRRRKQRRKRRSSSYSSSSSSPSSARRRRRRREGRRRRRQRSSSS
eukprot:TRINITY_DN11740_c0_g1_i1.p1 TRINITY_DN11740_c0_g1~~TRINITY_DN11740_c0_g1_i1.p1  ORF type:complete len:479 (-),score=89.07 TRINITY_DN11740_c0_g1_i1:30-1433(-)